MQDFIEKITRKICTKTVCANLGAIDNNLSIVRHHVCHYCGVVFSIPTANTTCHSNNSTLNIGEFKGYTDKAPDSSKWATRRHFFGRPANPLPFYSTHDYSSFSLHLNALLLKLKTIIVDKRIILLRHFQEADKRRGGACNEIEMRYVLMEICGLSEEEVTIILTICQQPQEGWFLYGDLINRLTSIDI